MNVFSLLDRNIVITGASSGIGKVCAVEFAKKGANLLLLGRNEERLAETLSEIKSISVENQQHLMYAIDFISELDKLSNALNLFSETCGKVSGFVHAAGIEKTLPIRAMKVSDYEDIFKVNAISGFELAKVISKKKYIAENASFVFISSITSVIGRVGIVGYAASKGAVVAGMKSMSLELASKNIRVNAISPGTILTPLMIKYLDSLPDEERIKRKEGFPLGLGQPEDVANTAMFLMSNASKWITGQNIVVDGGYTTR